MIEHNLKNSEKPKNFRPKQSGGWVNVYTNLYNAAQVVIKYFRKIVVSSSLFEVIYFDIVKCSS